MVSWANKHEIVIYTFMLRNRVIIPTDSADSGTGDPIPISCPVSRGNSLCLGVVSLTLLAVVSGKHSGLVSGEN